MGVEGLGRDEEGGGMKIAHLENCIYAIFLQHFQVEAGRMDQKITTRPKKI